MKKVTLSKDDNMKMKLKLKMKDSKVEEKSEKSIKGVKLLNRRARMGF